MKAKKDTRTSEDALKAVSKEETSYLRINCPKDLHKEIKYLAADLETDVKTLVVEALELLLKRYDDDKQAAEIRERAKPKRRRMK